MNIMPRVSKNKLPQDIQKQILNALVKAFLKIDEESALRKFMFDLLTPSETTMIAKRLMAAVLLQRGHAYQSICSTLKLSRATVFGIKRELEKGGEGYKRVFNQFFSKHEIKRSNRDWERIIDNWMESLRLPMKGSRSDFKRWKRAMSA